MKIFLSWSGERSRLIAEALKIWLPDLISFFDPWVSSEDIEKGARWELDLGEHLEATDIGIVCLTPENLNAPWILFESGALAKGLGRSRVCTYLFDLKPNDVTGPLVQFQATTATEDETFKLVNTLNKQLGQHARSTEQLKRIFSQWWPHLRKTLSEVPRTTTTQRNIRGERELLEEILDLVRQQSRHDMTTAEHIVGALKLSSFLGGSDLRHFADVVELAGGSEEPNAEVWARRVPSASELQRIDGVWSSRWNEEVHGQEDPWMEGSALIATHLKYFVLLHVDRRFEYLMLGEQNEDGLLVGRHFNINTLRDNSPWVGRIVSDLRIDGRWRGGRWDLQRLSVKAL